MKIGIDCDNCLLEITSKIGIETIQKIHSQGHQIYFISSIREDLATDMKNVLQQTFSFLNINDSLIITSNKRKVDVDIFINNSTKNIRSSKYYSILIDRFWNHNYDDAGNEKVYRVFDLTQIEPMIKTIEKILNVL